MRLVRLVRGVALVYVVSLLTATHWPALEIEGPVVRTDLYLHAAAFGLLTLLTAASGLFRPVLSARNAWCSAGLAVGLGAFDEVTQGIPALARTPMLSDWAADAGGAVAGACAWMILARLISPPR